MVTRGRAPRYPSYKEPHQMGSWKPNAAQKWGFAASVKTRGPSSLRHFFAQTAQAIHATNWNPLGIEGNPGPPVKRLE